MIDSFYFATLMGILFYISFKNSVIHAHNVLSGKTWIKRHVYELQSFIVRRLGLFFLYANFLHFEPLFEPPTDTLFVEFLSSSKKLAARVLSSHKIRGVKHCYICFHLGKERIPEMLF